MLLRKWICPLGGSKKGAKKRASSRHHAVTTFKCLVKRGSEKRRRGTEALGEVGFKRGKLSSQRGANRIIFGVAKRRDKTSLQKKKDA